MKNPIIHWTRVNLLKEGTWKEKCVSSFDRTTNVDDDEDVDDFDDDDVDDFDDDDPAACSNDDSAQEAKRLT